MKLRLKTIWLALLLFLCFGPDSAIAQIQEIKKIHIVSNWDGLGPSGHSELIIERKSDGYRAKGKRIDDGLVRDLLEALNAPPMSPNLSNLGITQNWLDANANLALKSYSAESYERAAENQRALFSTAFRDITLIARLMTRIIRGYSTDDYPSFQMEILKIDGQSVFVSTQEQPIFMLPLVISTDAQEIKTYNANISRAIANLLPLKFTNRERLSGSALLYDVAEKVMQEIETQWNWLDTENKIGPELNLLKDKYVLKETAISYLSSVDVGDIISR